MTTVELSRVQGFPSGEMIDRSGLQGVEERRDEVTLPDIPTDPLSTTLVSSALPSLGAVALSALQELTDEQRRATNLQRYQQAMTIVDTLHDQADKIRDNATTAFALAITSSVITIGASLYNVAQTSRMLNSTSSIESDVLRAATIQAETQRIGSVSQSLGGVANMFSSSATFSDTIGQAALKEYDAVVEQMRADNAQLDSLVDSLREVIRKAVETQESIAQAENQARTKILG